MSQENVETVRRLHEAHASGKLESVGKAVLAPQIEWQASDAFGVLRGRDEVLAYLRDFTAAFEDWQIVAAELVDAGDEVVGIQHASGIGRSSRVSMDARYAIVYTVHEGKIGRVREYATRSEALKAVGLEE